MVRLGWASPPPVEPDRSGYAPLPASPTVADAGRSAAWRSVPATSLCARRGARWEVGGAIAAQRTWVAHDGEGRHGGDADRVVGGVAALAPDLVLADRQRLRRDHARAPIGSPYVDLGGRANATLGAADDTRTPPRDRHLARRGITECEQLRRGHVPGVTGPQPAGPTTRLPGASGPAQPPQHRT